MEVFWNQATQPEWEALADHAHAPMQQRWTYGAVHAALGGTVHRAVVSKNGQPLALCQCLGRRFGRVFRVSLASRGPLWLTNCNQRHALALIRRTLPLPRPRLQLFTLPASLTSIRLLPLMTPATIATRTLPAKPDMLHGKWRNALRKAEKAKLTLRHTKCSGKDLHALLADDARQQSLQSYRAMPAGFSRKWHRIAPDDLRLFTAYEASQPIASALFLRHGNTASYHLAHNSARARQNSAQRLLLWHAFQALAAQGIAEIDLGPIDTENAPGLARFKLGTGAKARRLGPSVLAI